MDWQRVADHQGHATQDAEQDALRKERRAFASHPSRSLFADPWFPSNSFDRSFNAVRHISMSRNGKIARLPKDLRELVNRMLEDGAQHRSVIHELEKHRHRWPDKMSDINEDNVSNWKSGGYLDWLLEQDIQADLRARREYALELAKDLPEQHIDDVTLQMGINLLYHVLAGLDRDLLRDKLQADPAAWCKVVNTLARLSRDAIDLRKLKGEQEAHKEKINGKKPRAISDETRKLVMEELMRP